MYTKFLPTGLTIDNFRRLLDERFVYIGIAEDLPTSLSRLGAFLDFPPPRIPHANPSPRDEVVPAGARQRFIEKHPLEYAIYDLARQTYAK